MSTSSSASNHPDPRTFGGGSSEHRHTERPAGSSSGASSASSSKSTPASSFSQYQQNIQRQSREQKAVGSLLSGVAAVLIAGILIVAVLAGFGGYILWTEIQKQSVTVTQLGNNLQAADEKLGNDLKAEAAVIESLLADGKSQKQQIAILQKQLDDLRKSYTRQLAADQSKVQKLENRIYDLERQVQTR